MEQGEEVPQHHTEGGPGRFPPSAASSGLDISRYQSNTSDQAKLWRVVTASEKR